RDLDALRAELIEDAPVEFALHAPARRVAALDLTRERDGGAIDGIDAPEAEVRQNPRLELIVLAQRRADFLERGNREIDVLAIRDADAHGRVAESAIRVVHRRYRTERHGEKRAVAATQTHGADRQIFDRARDARERHPVADLHCVFHQQENARDEILHEL